jgi:hypothetical protein
MVFYTYMWLREYGSPYYVGKGHGNRAIRKGSPDNLNRILIQEHESEADAFAAEIFLINFYGRLDLGTGCLRNRTDGGEGATGQVQTSETVRRRVTAQAAFRSSDAERQRCRKQAMVQGLGSKVQPQVHVTPVLTGAKRPPFSDEWRVRMSTAKTGIKATMTEANIQRLAQLAALNTSDKGRKAAKARWGKRVPVRES